jgi:hypothetical protein
VGASQDGAGRGIDRRRLRRGLGRCAIRPRGCRLRGADRGRRRHRHGLARRELPGDATAGTTAWQSSTDAPPVQVARSWSTVTAADPAASGEVFVKGASLFGGELALRRLHVSVSQTAAGQTPTVGLRLRDLVIDGAPVAAPKPGGPTAARSATGAPSPSPRRWTNDGVPAIQVDVTADHNGVLAGTFINLGRVSFAAPHRRRHPRRRHHRRRRQRQRREHQPGPPPTPTRPPAPPQASQAATLRHQAKTQKRHHLTTIAWRCTIRPTAGAGTGRSRDIVRAPPSRSAGRTCGAARAAPRAASTAPASSTTPTLPRASAAGPANAGVLWQMGIPIAKRNLRPGDLVFLGTYSGSPTTWPCTPGTAW